MPLFVLTLLGSFLPLLLYRGGIPFVAVLFFVAMVAVLYLIAFRDGLIDSREKESRASMGVLFGGALFLGLFALANGFPVAPTYGAEDFFLWTAGFMLFTLSARLSFCTDRQESVMKGLLGFAVLSTGVGIVFFLTLGQARFFGTFGDPAQSYNAFPNAYANFLLLLFPFLHLFLMRAKGKEQWAWIFVGAVLLSGFFLALSRGAGLALFGMVFLAGLLLRPSKAVFWRGFRKWIPVFLATALFVNGLQFLREDRFEVVSLVEKATFQSDEGTASQDERVQFWMDSLDMMKDRPWLGSGPGTFSLVYPEYQNTFGVISGHPHNLFLKIGVEEGILAMAVAFLLVGFFWTAAFFAKAYRSPAFWGVLACFLHNLVDYNLNFSSIVFLSALLAGWTFREASSELKNRWKLFKPVKVASRWVLMALFVGSFLLAGLGLYEFYYKVHFVRGLEALNEGQAQTAEDLFEAGSAQIWEESLVLNWAEARLESGDLEGARALLEPLASETMDARYLTLLGSLGAKEEAGEWFLLALKLNSLNEIQYYYNVARTVGYDREALVDLLDLYTVQLSQNFHNTVLSENPKYADKLYRYLISTAVSEEERQALESAYELFTAVWTAEVEKFEGLFKVDL